MEVKDRIKELRTERQITMDLLAYDMNNKYEININKGLISKWESGKNDPSLRHAAFLADYFGVSLDYLIGLTDVRTSARLLAYAKLVEKRNEIRAKGNKADETSPELRKYNQTEGK